MLVSELLAMARLRLRALTGADAGTRRVRWVYTTDLLDPRRYLRGGELVLTGMVWRSGAGDSEVFAAALAEAGVAALAAGTAIGPVPGDLVEACRRHDVALIEVPSDISFATVTEEVLGVLTRDQSSATAQARGRHRQLMAELAAGGEFEDVFRRAAAEAGIAAWVLSSTGRVVARAGGELTGQDRVRLAGRYLSRPDFPCTADLTGAAMTLTLTPVRARDSHPLAGWFLACEGDHGGWGEDTREAVAELGSIAAMARGRVEERGLIDARHAEGLAELLAGRRFEEVAAVLRATDAGAGYARADAHVVVSAVLLPDPRAPGLARRVLTELLSAWPGAIAAGGGDALAVVPTGESEELRAGLAGGASALEPGLSEHRLAVGLSSASRGIEELRGAAVEARHARRLAELRGGRSRVIAGAEIDSHELLLASVPEEVQSSYRRRLLGPLLDYDRDHRSDLVHTLGVFLAHSCSWQRSATAMHVHVNTLRYRIGRVEELTGRDLSTLEHRVDLFLALRLRG